jgi:hypothetical protein
MKKLVFIILLCCSIVVQCSAGFNITECYKNCDRQESAYISEINSTHLSYIALCKNPYDDCQSLLTKLLSMLLEQSAKFNMSSTNMTTFHLSCAGGYHSCINNATTFKTSSLNSSINHHQTCIQTCNIRQKDENEHTRESRKIWANVFTANGEKAIIFLLFSKLGDLLRWIGGFFQIGVAGGAVL